MYKEEWEDVGDVQKTQYTWTHHVFLYLAISGSISLHLHIPLCILLHVDINKYGQIGTGIHISMRCRRYSKTGKIWGDIHRYTKPCCI